jgi:hypothetical protein
LYLDGVIVFEFIALLHVVLLLGAVGAFFN